MEKITCIHRKTNFGKTCMTMINQEQIKFGDFSYVMNSKQEAEPKAQMGEVSGNIITSSKIGGNIRSLYQHLQR